MDIEIHCETCEQLSHMISGEDSLEDQKYACSKCGAAIYWFSCPKCETGYQSGKPAAPCPGCPA